MRILISADLAGASGVVGQGEMARSSGDADLDYQMARRWLTGDVNAAVEGAMEADASAAFVLHDSPGPDQRTILLDELHPAVEVVRGGPIFFYEEADLARGYDAAFMIGMAAVGAGGVLSRTLGGPLVQQVRLNGKPAGEPDLTMALAAAYRIPTVLVSGDDQVCLDMQRSSGGKVQTAVVKYALSGHAARCLPLIEARERIRTAASEAVRHLSSVRPLALPRPIALEVEFGSREIARRVAWMPQVGYDGDCTISYIDEEFPTVYRVFLAMLWIAASRLNSH